MALVLVATPGGATSNTYCTVAEADTYHEAHYYASTWNAATTANKNIVLVMATRLLDQLVMWDGNKETTSQALRWPRTSIYDLDGHYISSGTIPQFLKDATAEFARILLASDRTADAETAGFKRIVIDDIELEVDKFDRPQTIPKSVWIIIKTYGSIIGKDRSLVRC